MPLQFMTLVHRGILICIGTALFLTGCVPLREAQEARIQTFRLAVKGQELPIPLPPGTTIDTVLLDPIKKSLTIRFSKELSYDPFRKENVARTYSAVKDFFRDKFSDYSITVQTLERPIEELIPNFFRKDSSEYDWTRIPKLDGRRPVPVVRNASTRNNPVDGLKGRNIGLWHSHGWYYNNREDRWEWQRPRLFESVEDLGPMSFTLPYVIPMLENAGANVFVPRERDIQTNEVVVDNDTPSKSYVERSTGPRALWKTGVEPGFAAGGSPYVTGVNPFLKGTHRTALSDTFPSASASWIPDIPETGYYAVYISYTASDRNATDASYSVFHTGGKTDFKVNQQIGGSTWLHLGRFRFWRGIHPDSGRVTLTNQNLQPGSMVSADGVRFGGGTGVIARGGATSGRAKYLEGARYYLQYAGLPDTLVYSLNNNQNDYRDDYLSRPEYVNYLNGAPLGPNKDRKAKGLGIPMDISMAFHTDAGISHSDTTIGTLSIYNIQGLDSATTFPDGTSRLANRDLADLVQTQIVNDLRTSFDPIWNRRQLRNADYAEATRPNVPGVLLELLSHQNFLDMKFMRDPRFRFDVARGIYKAMLKFLSVQRGGRYIVQPLAVTRFCSEFTPDGRVKLQWRGTTDPLEPTAAPESYILYTRVDDGDFDTGRSIAQSSTILDDLAPGRLYSFRVTAVNSGGESFPSEVLSVCSMRNNKPTVLIVNGFDRICGPATIETPAFSGFFDADDAGVAEGFALNFTGMQYDFNTSSSFKTNDAPGHGASHADQEGGIVAGNTFDYPAIHGQSIRNCGLSFVSASREAVMDSLTDLTKYRMVDLILGKEKETRWQKSIMDSLRGTQFRAFPRKFQDLLQSYADTGGNLFVSGAYVGTDLYANGRRDSLDAKFASSVLRFTWVTGHAAQRGSVIPVAKSIFPDSLHISFATTPRGAMYGVEAPDAVGPAQGSKTVLRYSENLFSAATAFKGPCGIVVFGFPFETITTHETRDAVMQAVLSFFDL